MRAKGSSPPVQTYAARAPSSRKQCLELSSVLKFASLSSLAIECSPDVSFQALLSSTSLWCSPTFWAPQMAVSPSLKDLSSLKILSKRNLRKVHKVSNLERSACPCWTSLTSSNFSAGPLVRETSMTQQIG